MITLTQTSCKSSSGFSDSGGGSAAEKADSIPSATNTVSEEFSLASGETPVDMVWVVDNSGSMFDESEQIEKNFESFVSSLDSFSNLKMAVLSRPKGDDPVAPEPGVTLPSRYLGSGHKQFPFEVGSTNLFAMAASASCEQGETGEIDDSDFSLQMQICSKSYVETADPLKSKKDYHKLIESPQQIESVSGVLRSFFRAQAQKVFLFVTDDDTGVFGEKDFIETFTATTGVAPIIYAVRGTADDVLAPDTVVTEGMCFVAAHGVSYETAATQTGGQVYDICGEDWSLYFGDVSKDLESIVTTQIVLSNLPLEILSVTLDGVAVDSNKYELNGKTLTFDVSFIEGHSSIEVHYSYQESD